MALGALEKKVSLSEKAYQMLREAILGGELKQGEALTEEGVAELLGISRTPVRTALQQLTAEGLLKAGRKNLTVAGVEEEELREIDRVRAELESLSAELNCLQGLSEEQVAELETYCRRQTEAAKAGDVRTFFQEGENFHVRLAEFSGNRYLAEMIRQASTAAVRFLTAGEAPERFLDGSGQEHEEVLRAILSGDVAAAKERMRAHVFRG